MSSRVPNLNLNAGFLKMKSCINDCVINLLYTLFIYNTTSVVYFYILKADL